MKWIYSTVFIFFFTDSCFSLTCKIKFRFLKSNNFEYIHFYNDNDSLIYSGKSLTDSFYYDNKSLDPALIYFEINGDNKNYNEIFVDTTIIDFFVIGANAKNIIFNNSKLNDEHQYIHSTMIYYSKIRNILFQNFSTSNKEQIDSISQCASLIIEKIINFKYQYYYNNPSSYISLYGISEFLKNNTFTKQEIRFLFENLNKNLSKYRLWEYCNAILKIDKIKMGEEIESFEALNTLKESVTLNLQEEEKKVFLLFWSTRCAPCISELKMLNEKYQRIDTSKIRIIAINTDDSLDEFSYFVDKNKYTRWENYWLIKGRNHYLPQALGISYLPSSFLVNEKGKFSSLLSLNELLQKYYN